MKTNESETVAIFKFRGDWHFGWDGTPHRLSEGYESKARATATALNRLKDNGQTVTSVTGAADRQTARRFGVNFIDPRGRRRRESPTAERNRSLNMLFKRAKAGTIDWEVFKDRVNELFNE